MDIKNRKSISQSASYFDDYQRGNYWNETAKNYQSVLFKGGKPLQSRELNLLQSMLHERIKNSNDIEFRNGSVVEGCDIEVTNNGDVKISKGIVYWDGTFFDIDEHNLSNDIVSGEQTETEKNLAAIKNSTKLENPLYVYLNVKYETINSTKDSELSDPSIKYKVGEYVDGADRLQITFLITLLTEKESNISNQYIPIGIISNDKTVTLINRNYRLENDDKEHESKVVKGLRIKNVPFREPFSINKDNEEIYKDKSFVELESGSCLINGEKVVSMGTKVFNFDKNLSTVETFNNKERHIKEYGDELIGSFWGDIAHGKIADKALSTDTLNLIYCGLLTKGRKVKIKMRLPITIGMNKTTNKPIYGYFLFDVAEAEIADAIQLKRDDNIDDTIPPFTFVIPGIIDVPKPIIVSTPSPIANFGIDFGKNDNTDNNSEQSKPITIPPKPVNGYVATAGSGISTEPNTNSNG